LGPNTGALAHHTRPKAGLGVGCGRVSPPPTMRVRGITPGKIFENSDTKSCILVTTCCEISCFLNTTAKKSGANTLLVPQPKSWGPVSPAPYGCCAYGYETSRRRTVPLSGQCGSDVSVVVAVTVAMTSVEQWNWSLATLVTNLLLFTSRTSHSANTTQHPQSPPSTGH